MFEDISKINKELDAWEEFYKKKDLRKQRWESIKSIMNESRLTEITFVEVDDLFEVIMNHLYKNHPKVKRESFTEKAIQNFFICECDGEFIDLGVESRGGLEPAHMYRCATCGQKFGII